MLDSISRDRRPPPLRELDTAAVEQLTALAEAWREHLNLDDAEWGLAILRAYAELPPIANAAQCRAYRRRLSQIRRTKLPRHGYGGLAAFLRTSDGVVALALGGRIEEWEKTRAARAKRLRRRIEDLIIAAVCWPIDVAGKIRRLLNGRN